MRLYESYIHPITILSTLPSAGVGALLALMVDGSDLSIIAIIGVILLIGIVKKNGIMIVDFALEAQRDEGKTPREAIYQASLLRFRPIKMTTMAAMFGALPLMLGTGTGSELRHPLGVTIVGGLILSQLLTLFTTPVIYLYFDRLGRAVRQRLAGAFNAEGMRDRPLSILSRRVHRAARSQHPADDRLALAGIFAFFAPPAGAAAANRLSDGFRAVAQTSGPARDDGDNRRDVTSNAHLRVIADVTRDDLAKHRGIDPHHPQCSSRWAATSTVRARRVQAAIVAARVDLPTSLRTNPTTARSIRRMRRS